MSAPTITYAARPPLVRLPTVLAACLCRVWPVPAAMPFGRCGRCATGVRYVAPDPESVTDHPPGPDTLDPGRPSETPSHLTGG